MKRKTTPPVAVPKPLPEDPKLLDRRVKELEKVAKQQDAQIEFLKRAIESIKELRQQRAAERPDFTKKSKPRGGRVN